MSRCCRSATRVNRAASPVMNTVGAGMLIERDHLLPITGEAFDLAEISFPTVDGAGCVRVRINACSVRMKAGQTVQARRIKGSASTRRVDTSTGVVAPTLYFASLELRHSCNQELAVRIFPGAELHSSTLFAGCRHGRTVSAPA